MRTRTKKTKAIDKTSNGIFRTQLAPTEAKMLLISLIFPMLIVFILVNDNSSAFAIIGVVLWVILQGILGIYYLYLIEMDEEGIYTKLFWRRKFMKWEDVVKVEENSRRLMIIGSDEQMKIRIPTYFQNYVDIVGSLYNYRPDLWRKKQISKLHASNCFLLIAIIVVLAAFPLASLFYRLMVAPAWELMLWGGIGFALLAALPIIEISTEILEDRLVIHYLFRKQIIGFKDIVHLSLEEKEHLIFIAIHRRQKSVRKIGALREGTFTAFENLYRLWYEYNFSKFEGFKFGYCQNAAPASRDDEKYNAN